MPRRVTAAATARLDAADPLALGDLPPQHHQVADVAARRADHVAAPLDLWGTGLLFERVVQFMTGMANIRDVIPFPRVPRSAEFRAGLRT